MPTFSPRLPHLFPRPTVARLLTSTYAAAQNVEDDEAHDRLLQALEARPLLDDLHRGLSAALAARQGPRTSADQLLDKVSAALQTRSGLVRAAEATPGISAVMVRINLELGLAPEPMRETLRSPRGAAALEDGVAALGRHILKELLK